MKEYLEVLKVIADLGGTVLVVCILIYCTYKFVSRFGESFIVAQQQMAEAMVKQSESMASLSVAVQQFIGKDNAEHREILLGMQVVGEELKDLVSEIRRLDRRSANE